MVFSERRYFYWKLISFVISAIFFTFFATNTFQDFLEFEIQKSSPRLYNNIVTDLISRYLIVNNKKLTYLWLVTTSLRNLISSMSASLCHVKPNISPGLGILSFLSCWAFDSHLRTGNFPSSKMVQCFHSVAYFHRAFNIRVFPNRQKSVPRRPLRLVVMMILQVSPKRNGQASTPNDILLNLNCFIVPYSSWNTNQNASLLSGFNPTWMNVANQQSLGHSSPCQFVPLWWWTHAHALVNTACRLFCHDAGIENHLDVGDCGGKWFNNQFVCHKKDLISGWFVRHSLYYSLLYYSTILYYSSWTDLIFWYPCSEVSILIHYFSKPSLTVSCIVSHLPR